MKTILVTGGAGFIGSHVCDRLLAAGHPVVALDDLSTGDVRNLSGATGSSNFVFHRRDIRAKSLRSVFVRHRPEVVVHLAAQAGVRPSLKDPSFDASVNIAGLLNVLELAAASGVRRILFASSGGTIYGRPRRLPVREESRFGSRPASPYGISKKTAENYLRFYRSNHGLEYCILAMANVYGPRQDPHGEAGVVAIFGAEMLAGRTPTIFGDGEQTRDYVFVDDAAEAFSRALDRGDGKLINIGSGRETSVNRIFAVLAKLARFKSAPLRGPLPLGEIDRICLDPTQARDLLGWRATIGLEQGLRRTVDYLRLDKQRAEPAQGLLQ